MKLYELEDADKIPTKEFFEARISQLELALTQTIIASERAQRSLVFGAYGMILGTYALIVAAIYVNHFWH